MLRVVPPSVVASNLVADVGVAGFDVVVPSVDVRPAGIHVGRPA
jgi:hypothetical protein